MKYTKSTLLVVALSLIGKANASLILDYDLNGTGDPAEVSGLPIDNSGYTSGYGGLFENGSRIGSANTSFTVGKSVNSAYFGLGATSTAVSQQNVSAGYSSSISLIYTDTLSFTNTSVEMVQFFGLMNAVDTFFVDTDAELNWSRQFSLTVENVDTSNSDFVSITSVRSGNFGDSLSTPIEVVVNPEDEVKITMLVSMLNNGTAPLSADTSLNYSGSALFGASVGTLSGFDYSSSNGLSYSFSELDMDFSIIPEPNTFLLIAVAGVFALQHRKRLNRQI